MTEHEQKVLDLIGEWGGIDGGHHKQWLLDQLVRELTGDDYEKWVADWEDGEDGPETYRWDRVLRLNREQQHDHPNADREIDHESSRRPRLIRNCKRIEGQWDAMQLRSR